MTPHNSYWGVLLNVYEGASEATATLGYHREQVEDEGRELRRAASGCKLPTDNLADVETPHDRTDHDRRAGGRIRRYAVVNRCTRLVTLTYADQHQDLRRVVRDVQAFQRRLHQAYPDVVWLRAFERHKSGAIHVHYAVNRRLDHAVAVRLWPHGFVWLSPKVRTKRGGAEDARVAARYVSKYVVKDPVRLPGGHRYEVRQGYQPIVRRVLVDADDPSATLELLTASLGAVSTYQWSSATAEDWRGPPVAFTSW